MTDQFAKANAHMAACLKLWDKAVRSHAAGGDGDEALSGLAEQAGRIPDDASEAHECLFRSLASGGNLVRSRAADGKIATNPSHYIPEHWDSTASVEALWGGLIHGGVLTLENGAGRDRFLLFGGRCHVDSVLRKDSNGHTRRFAWKTGLGLTIRRFDGLSYSEDVLTTQFSTADDSKGHLNTWFFGPDGFRKFDALRRKSDKTDLMGAYVRTDKRNAILPHLVRTAEVDERLWWTRGKSQRVFRAKTEAHRDFTWKPGDDALPEDANRHDPFSAHFAPDTDDDNVLHRSAYVRVISPDPRSRPAIVTYIHGFKYEYTNPKIRWKKQKPAEWWRTEFALIP